MNKKVYIFLIVICFIAFAFLPSFCIYAEDLQSMTMSQDSDPIVTLLLDNNNWSQTNKTDGVIHYSKSVENSVFDAYKGVSTIECPLDLLYSILCNVSAHAKWIKYCDSSIEVERPTPNNSIQYYTFNIPWPLSDRDVVVNCKVDTDWDEGRIVIKSTAIKDPHDPVPVQKKLSRVTNSKQIWILESVSSSQTKVTFYSYASMEGLVPKLLNNLISSVIPSQSLTNLKQISSDKLRSSSLKVIADVY